MQKPSNNARTSSLGTTCSWRQRISMAYLSTSEAVNWRPTISKDLGAFFRIQNTSFSKKKVDTVLILIPKCTKYTYIIRHCTTSSPTSTLETSLYTRRPCSSTTAARVQIPSTVAPVPLQWLHPEWMDPRKARSSSPDENMQWKSKWKMKIKSCHFLDEFRISTWSSW